MDTILDPLGDGRCRMHLGDVLDRLADMEPDSVDCVVTSPPYWGLRDYGVEGQIGLEPTLAEHLAIMVRVFEAVRRVLKPTGTLWLNYGDCYATAPNGRSAADYKANDRDDRTFRDKPFSTVGGTLKPKDLCMIPNRLAIALQDAGWWVRSEIVWGKSNPMPDSSGTARPATAHEKIFLLTKSGDGDVWRARDTGEISYCPDLSERCALITDAARDGARWLRLGAYYDAAAVRVSRAGDEDAATYRGGSYVGGAPGGRRVVGNKCVGKQRGHSRRHDGFNGRWDAMSKAEQTVGGRLLRSYEDAPETLDPRVADLTVWRMATKPFSDAHFATFPAELAKRCIQAGCPPGGLVLDPFGGAGTTALVALRLGRRAGLIELNPDYANMAGERIRRDWMGPDERRRAIASAMGGIDAGPLFGRAGT